jgi:hypothetical protein
MKKDNADRRIFISSDYKLSDNEWRQFCKLYMELPGFTSLDKLDRETFGREKMYRLIWLGQQVREPRLLLEEAQKIPAEGNLAEQKLPPAPPKPAEFLFQALADPADAEAALGDLDECFHRDCLEFGSERARRRYWGRVFRSLLPLLRRAACVPFNGARCLRL